MSYQPTFNFIELLSYLSTRYRTENKAIAQILIGFLFYSFQVLCDRVTRIENILQKQMVELHTHDHAMERVENMTKKLEIAKIQMVGTLDELEEMGDLNFNWSTHMASLLDRL